MGFIRFFRNWLRHDSIVRQRLDLQYHELYELHNMMQEDRKRIKIDELREKTLCSTMKGVSDDLLCEHEVIVSLTSFGKRIYDVHLAIESIMQGSVKPNRIILWLSEEEFKGKPLPKTLEKQKNRGLQIEYCEDLRSYKKIVPTMEKYPDARIFNSIYPTVRLFKEPVPVQECSKEFIRQMDIRLEDTFKEMFDLRTGFRRTSDDKVCSYCDFKMLCGK